MRSGYADGENGPCADLYYGQAVQRSEHFDHTKAFEYAGYQLIRSCGCRGGICGACATVYRLPESPKIYVGLACQTVVQPNMYIAMVPFFPANRAIYDLEQITPDVKTL